MKVLENFDVLGIFATIFPIVVFRELRANLCSYVCQQLQDRRPHLLFAKLCEKFYLCFLLATILMFPLPDFSQGALTVDCLSLALPVAWKYENEEWKY